MALALFEYSRDRFKACCTVFCRASYLSVLERSFTMGQVGSALADCGSVTVQSEASISHIGSRQGLHNYRLVDLWFRDMGFQGSGLVFERSRVCC